MLEKWRKLRSRIPYPVMLLGVAVVGVVLGAWLFGGGGDSNAEPSAAHGAPGHVHREGEAEEAQVWTCSMHPQIRLDSPGQCPICGMDLIPLSDSGGQDDLAPNQIALSSAANIRARIRTTPVVRLGAGGVERRLLGRVDYDETTLRTVTAWTGGRIDRLMVRVTGERVRRGQVIAYLYSPELHSAHQDLLQAKHQLERLSKATPSAQLSGRSALAAARDRLRLLGVPRREIDAMERAENPSDNIAIRTPFGGTVIERIATEGNYVTTGTGLYRVADLSKLWVQLDAYESDLPLLRVGQEVSLSVEALPNEHFTGRVTFVDPVLNRRTRTARVRIEVRNKQRHLRPGMFAEATVVGSAEDAAGAALPLVIPKSAALFTGRRSVVYVAVPDKNRPTYEARVVRLGTVMGDVYPVLGGLAEGDRVVVNGAFVLDADLQIRGGIAMMAQPDDKSAGSFDNIVQVPEAFRDSLAGVLEAYLKLHAALAGDAFESAQSAAAQLRRLSDGLEPSPGSAFHDAWMPIARHFSAHTAHMAHAKELAELRVTFRDVSQQVATILRVLGNPTSQPLRLAFCPMALDGAGAEWVQRSEGIENPYFGASMHGCGEVHNTVEHGTYLPASQDDQVARRAAPAGGHQH